jgi:hypothetical protein
MPSHKHLKQLSTEASGRAYNSYITNIISPDSTENPKRFWGFIRSEEHDKTPESFRVFCRIWANNVCDVAVVGSSTGLGG